MGTSGRYIPYIHACLLGLLALESLTGRDVSLALTSLGVGETDVWFIGLYPDHPYQRFRCNVCGVNFGLCQCVKVRPLAIGIFLSYLVSPAPGLGVEGSCRPNF